MLALEREQKAFDPSLFFEKGDPSHPEQRGWVTTSAFYQTRYDLAAGRLTITDRYLLYEIDMSNSSDENLTKNCEMYNLMIDYLDIVSVSRLQIPNEEAADHPEQYVRKNYTFNYLVQIEVSAINGLSVIQSKKASADEKELGAEIEGEDKAIFRRSNISLANIFFKVSFLLMTQSLSLLTRCNTRRSLSRDTSWLTKTKRKYWIC